MTDHPFRIIPGDGEPKPDDATDLEECLWTALAMYAEKVPMATAVGILELIKVQIITGATE